MSSTIFNCPHCGVGIENPRKVCPNCRGDISEAVAEQHSSVLANIAAALVVAPLFFGLTWLIAVFGFSGNVVFWTALIICIVPYYLVVKLVYPYLERFFSG